MLVCLPFFDGDKDQAVKLAEWIKELDGVQNHSALLCISRTTDEKGVMEPMREAFGTVAVFQTPKECDEPFTENEWAQPATRSWKATAWHIFYNHKRPWLWCEPDAIPTRRTWLDELEAEYIAAKKPFMGTHGANLNVPMINGVAIYAPDVCNYSTTAMLSDKSPWDYNGREDFLKHGHISPLFQHVYFVGEGENREQPTFPKHQHLLRPETALFHRCKDGSLPEMLRKKLSVVPVLADSRAGATAPQSGSSNGVSSAEHGEARDQAPIKDGLKIQSESCGDGKLINQIRSHCDALVALADNKTSRSLTILDELRKRKLAPRARRR